MRKIHQKLLEEGIISNRFVISIKLLILSIWKNLPNKYVNNTLSNFFCLKFTFINLSFLFDYIK